MLKIFFYFIILVSIYGCTSIKPKPVTGSSSAVLRLPDVRNIEDAKSDCRLLVQALMYDKAAEEFRDNELSSLKQYDLLSLPDTEETRLEIVRRTVEEHLITAIKERSSSIFTMTRWIPNYHYANGDILNYNFKSYPSTNASKGVYSGTFDIGRNYCYHVEGRRYCDKKEVYKVALNGNYSVDTTSLEMTYNAVKTHHDGSLGLSSKLNLNALSYELSHLADRSVKVAHNEVDNRYKDVVNRTADKIVKRLEKRVIVRPIEVATIGESTFHLGFETSMARLQRRLDKFKYDKDNSTFVFDLDRHEETWYGKKVPMREQITVKLFPEKNNTVVVYKLEYLPVYDDLADKNLYTVADAKARVNAIVAQVESNLKK